MRNKLTLAKFRQNFSSSRQISQIYVNFPQMRFDSLTNQVEILMSYEESLPSESIEDDHSHPSVIPSPRLWLVIALHRDIIIESSSSEPHQPKEPIQNPRFISEANKWIRSKEPILPVREASTC